MDAIAWRKDERRAVPVFSDALLGAVAHDAARFPQIGQGGAVSLSQPAA
jgi:hypothetical protein